MVSFSALRSPEKYEVGELVNILGEENQQVCVYNISSELPFFSLL